MRVEAIRKAVDWQNQLYADAAQRANEARRQARQNPSIGSKKSPVLKAANLDYFSEKILRDSTALTLDLNTVATRIASKDTPAF